MENSSSANQISAAEAAYHIGKLVLGIVCLLLVGVQLAVTLPHALGTVRRWNRELRVVDFHGMVAAGDYLKLNNTLRNIPFNVDVVDRQGRTPLHVAVQLGHTAIAELLLSKGADVNRPVDSGQHPTPLHLAAARGDVEMIRLLLRCHADLNLKTTDGLTPRQLAVQMHHPEAAKLLSAAGSQQGAAPAGFFTPAEAQTPGPAEQPAPVICIDPGHPSETEPRHRPCRMGCARWKWCMMWRSNCKKCSRRICPRPA